MHIADGILPAGPLIAANAAAMAGVWLAGRRIASEEVVRMGMVSAAIFSVSMVHFPVGGTSIHLGLFGAGGILLGRRCVPVAFATLLFQALIAQHGGLLTLGLNTINMATGMLLAAAIWKLTPVGEATRAFFAGFLGTMLPAAMVAVEFWLAGYGKGFGVIAGAYSVVALIEGALTSFLIAYLRRVKPAVLARSAA